MYLDILDSDTESKNKIKQNKTPREQSLYVFEGNDFWPRIL